MRRERAVCVEPRGERGGWKLEGREVGRIKAGLWEVICVHVLCREAGLVRETETHESSARGRVCS